jgi:hypothetical protein
MEEIIHRFFENLIGRLDGPLHFRFILQPLMAVIFAILSGIKDAKTGKEAFLWKFIRNREYRWEMIKDGWKHVGKLFILAIILDLVYQWKVSARFYPVETLTVAFLLAIIPYLLLRGPINRIVRKFKK